MIKLPKENPIWFLIERCFPDYRVLKGSLDSVSFIGEGRIDHRKRFEKRRAELEEYESKLNELSQEDLQSLYETEKEKRKQELIQQLDKEEQSRFYNLPCSNADFEHWSKTAFWTLEEAVALSFGKNPDLVSWNKLKDHTKNSASPFIERYRKTLELVRRAKVARQISDPVCPGTFIAWAKRNGLDFPQNLVDKVKALEKANTLVTNKQGDQSDDTNQTDKVLSSEYLQGFLGKAKRIVDEYPPWKKTQPRKIQKTGNLHNWLREDIGADTREAELLKKILSDIFKDLR